MSFLSVKKVILTQNKFYTQKMMMFIKHTLIALLLCTFSSTNYSISQNTGKSHTEKISRNSRLQPTQNASKKSQKKSKYIYPVSASMWIYNSILIGGTVLYIIKRKDHFTFDPHDIFQQFVATYWIISLIVYILYNSPLMRPYKVPRQAQKHHPSYWLVILQVLINQLIHLAPIQELAKDLPQETDKSWGTLGIDGIITYLCYTIIFYIVHRLLHTPLIYQHIHSVHHEFEVPLGFTSLYAHPLEAFVDVLPPVIGMWLTGSSLHAARFWMLLGIINTVIVHTNAGRHSHHHLLHKYNFSTDDIDLLLDTDYTKKLFKKRESKKIDATREEQIKRKIDQLATTSQIISISRWFQHVNFVWSLLLSIWAIGQIYDTHGTSYAYNLARKKAFILLGIGLPILLLSLSSILLVYSVIVKSEKIILSNVLKMNINIPYQKISKLDKKVLYTYAKKPDEKCIKSLLLVIHYQGSKGIEKAFLSDIEYQLPDLLFLEKVLMLKNIPINVSTAQPHRRLACNKQSL